MLPWQRHIRQLNHQKTNVCVVILLVAIFDDRGSRVFDIKVNETQVSKTVFSHLKRDQNPKSSHNDTRRHWKRLYCMACVFSWYDAHSDWLAPGYYSPVMPTGRLRASIDRAKNEIIYNSLTSNVRSLKENLMIEPRPTVLTSLSLGHYGKALV